MKSFKKQQFYPQDLNLDTYEKQKAIEDYNSLVNLDVRVLRESLVGMYVLKYVFFIEFLKVQKGGSPSASDIINNKKEFQKYYERYIKYYKKNPSTLLELVSFIRYNTQSPTLFRPTIAKHLYMRYNATSVLDFSMGWGGRLLGATSLGINFIGIDSNTNLKPLYNELIQLLKSQLKKNTITLIFKPSQQVDFSKFDYDMVFTSPPYMLLEKYQHSNYEDNEDFLKKFYNPVVLNSYKHLKKGGHFCLNIPDEMVQITVDLIGTYATRIKLPVRSRVQKNQRQPKFVEYIYVWNK